MADFNDKDGGTDLNNDYDVVGKMAEQVGRRPRVADPPAPDRKTPTRSRAAGNAGEGRELIDLS